MTHEAADAALEPLLETFAKDMPKNFPEHFRVKVEGLNEWVASRDRGGTLHPLLDAVALLLAIGCGNVSILLLARGTARQQELAFRAAVGASRSRMVGQLLTESLLLAAIRAALGVLTASTECCRPLRGCYPGMPFSRRGGDPHQSSRFFFSVGWLSHDRVYSDCGRAQTLADTAQPSDAGECAPGGGKRTRSQSRQDARIAGQIAPTLLLLAAAGSAMKAL